MNKRNKRKNTNNNKNNNQKQRYEEQSEENMIKEGEGRTMRRKQKNTMMNK